MKALLTRAYAALVTAAGGRPDVVLPLYHGIENAARGQQELLRQKSRRRSRITADALRLILLVATALGSIFLALFMVLNPEDTHPHWGVLILVTVHWLLIINLVVSQAGPSLLVDDDQLIMGWWPVTRRELLLARLGTVFKPALQATAALGTVPLLVFLITGRPPLLAGISLAVGLLIQAVGLTFGVATALAMILRWFGRRRAQRLAALMADGNSFMYLWFLSFLIPRMVPWMGEHPRVLWSLPPVWFAAFGDPFSGPYSWAMAGLGVLTTAGLVFWGLKLLGSDMTAGEAEVASSRPGRWHFSSLISRLLAPVMPGREGWVLRRLLESHLRDDWRFLGGMATIPLVMIFMFFVREDTAALGVDPEQVRFTALTAVHNSYFLLIMGASVLFAASFSSTPRALWLVALSDLDSGRLLAAQRGMIRGLVLLPVLVIYAVKAGSIGAPPLVVAADCLLLGVQLDIILILLQPLLLIMPFSLAYTNDQTARRIGLSFLVMAVALVFILLNFLYAEFFTARLLIWAGLPLVWFLGRKWHNRRVAGRRLNMDAVLHG